MCGGIRFEGSFPVPGEESWAMTIYRQELIDAGLWTPLLSTKRFRELGRPVFELGRQLTNGLAGLAQLPPLARRLATQPKPDIRHVTPKGRVTLDLGK
jgi:hypothetical protein